MIGIFLSIVAVMMALLALFIRMKAMKKPATVRKIMIPPLAMSTGFLMFLYPPVRPSALELIEAFSVGLLFSILLIKLSSFEIRDNNIYMKRSKAFPFILFGLLAVRLLAKTILGIHFEYEVLAGMFFVLAFGMILPWRLAMLYKFKQVEKEFKLKQNSNANWNFQSENPTPRES
ncbi:membrane protein CcdC involved in cytochrome C biogenesis [Evansella vedderi]|uniref:Membrane protein CcdC involved in cytochrome C biogenesis n=1 Tax=Evansella vedderi TaxID=38282 RepID=A0ABT9ZQU4_9BACI|nr:cytochrome c biogenesis protein CcdC [Evansella vedderi]MDQ0253603.1 membrane protein CcdC involved in cytochrome C biogenesis [Evansella vedderi]